MTTLPQEILLNKIKETKCKLYHLLLQLDPNPNTISDSNLDMMVALMKDEDIQLVLDQIKQPLITEVYHGE